MSLGMKLFLRAVFAIAVAIALVVPSLYILYMGQPEIAVEEGSASYSLRGDFFNTNGSTLSFSNLNATTLIAEKGFNDFALRTSMSGFAWSDKSSNPLLYFVMTLYVSGNLSYNLHPSGLRITAAPLSNSTYTFKTYFGRSVAQYDNGYDLISPQVDNVSKSGGGLDLNLSLLNDSGLRQPQTFNFSVMDIITNQLMLLNSSIGIPVQYNTTYGISVTASLEGLSNPVSTTLYLFFIDVP